MSGVRYGTIDTDYAMRLATSSDDGPIHMINLMKYREVADYGDRSGEGAVARSGKDADDEYAPLESLAAIGAEVVFFADVDTQLLGADPVWDRIGVVKYPTRRSFIEMQSRPDFREKHVHKDAGMERTIVMGGLPTAVPELPADAPRWADVAHPPTDDDGPVVVLHVIRYHEGKLDTEMATYQQHAGDVAVPHGVRIAGWFDIEGTIVGDGRTWHQARFNSFPSKAAFMAVATDPARLAAQHAHREVAIADTYTMILRPTIDRLTPRDV
jgi:hypothetical protein